MNDRYQLKISEPADKWLDKFNKETLKRFYRKIDKLKTFPDVHGKPLRSPFRGIWELRFEKRWRVYYRIYYQERIVRIICLEHKDEKHKTLRKVI